MTDHIPAGDSKMKRRDFLGSLSAASAVALGVSKVAVSELNTAEKAPEGAKIASLGVFPPIGISRVGNSQEWFYAPELPGMPPRVKGGLKDGEEQIKKQVQRFRVYAFDEKGRVIREITAREAKITWKVRVANTKAAWYGFNNPLDNGPVAPGLPGQKRNQDIAPDQREEMLVIDSNEVAISGASANLNGDESEYLLQGNFWNDTTVKLGQLRTDDSGRLLVFPGDGDSGTPVADNPIDNFSDNDGWYDDWCDGYVDAEVTFTGQTPMSAMHGWVACCGPNFAPEIPAFITLHDTIRDVMIRKRLEEMPKKLSFRRDIYPLFQRLGLMEWVASSASLRQGWIRVGDFNDPRYIARLADSAPENKPFRDYTFRQFRDPGSEEVQQYKLPYMLGDGVNYDFSPSHWFLIPQTQYGILKQWAEGNFVNDFENEEIDGVESVDDLDVALHPDALTRAALEPCSGGAFHPGVELTWPMRQSALYQGDTGNAGTNAYRIARGHRESLTQDIGRLRTPEKAFKGTKETPPPIGPQMPGDLTRWMGIPWQCDAFSCQFVEFGNDFPNAVWWPALLPIDVLPQAYYNQVLRTDLDADTRLKFAESRVTWSRGVSGIGYHAEASYSDGLSRMVALWDRMGFVVKRPGPDDKNAPEKLRHDFFVEVDRGSMDLTTNEPPNEGVKALQFGRRRRSDDR